MNEKALAQIWKKLCKNTFENDLQTFSSNRVHGLVHLADLFLVHIININIFSQICDGYRQAICTALTLYCHFGIYVFLFKLWHRESVLV